MSTKCGPRPWFLGNNISIRTFFPFPSPSAMNSPTTHLVRNVLMCGGPLSRSTSNVTVMLRFSALSCTCDTGDLRSSNSGPPGETALAGFFLVEAAAVAAEAVATGCPGTNGSEAGFRHLGCCFVGGEVAGEIRGSRFSRSRAFDAAACFDACADDPSP